MNEIIRKEYIKLNGPRSLGIVPPEVWEIGLVDFTAGWLACSEWEQEQREMEKDVLYQQEGLTRGE